MDRLIYMDHAATTPLLPEPYEAMRPWLEQEYFNPSSTYASAQRAKAAVEQARAAIAETLGAATREVYFTSGGTESDNWALKGTAFANRSKGNHVIVSAIEHHAVLEPAKWLQRNGFEVTFLPVDNQGRVAPEALAGALRDGTVLVSVMMANNEVGTIQDAPALASLTHERGALFHTDAVQAFGHVPVNVAELGVDLLSISAHKLGGPKGVGCLYVKRGTAIEPLLHGGAQERGKRASTENVAGIVGFATAASVATAHMGETSPRVSHLRDRFISDIVAQIPNARINGAEGAQRLPGNVNVSFKDVSSEALLLLLDQDGICASAGSACSSGSLESSHVLAALGLTSEWATGTIRFSLAVGNTEEEVDAVLESLKRNVAQLRAAAQ